MASSILDLSNKEGAHIDQRLRENVIGWLTTVRPDGRPHAVAVWFLWDGETILIFSKPNQQKLRNLQNNPNVLLLIDDTHQGSDPISVEGTATLLKPSEVDITLDAYVKKYGEHIKRIGYTPETMARAYSEGIRIVPTRIA
ncbi:MAG TPA: TIGR03667 family PPOX class F420-dependent oxidoreductase [Ktedonobacteraceae bacterium]|nr:TIGR03667 family PPOX class F420-dependent oxidoreductase [Ktedonobacteraceae bacterium]